MIRLRDLKGLSPTQLKKAVRYAFKANRPLFVHGPPGVGKSDIITQIADELTEEAKSKTDKRPWEIRDLRLYLLNPTDLRGIPVADMKSATVKWFPPGFLPSDMKSRGVLFLDELPTAPQATQAAAYQLVQDREVGEYKLPKDWRIVAAGNRTEDKALVFEMPSPLRSRFDHVDLRPDIEDFVRYGVSVGMAKEVLAFMRHLGSEHLFAYDHAVHRRGFPCSRTWHMVSDLITKAGLPLNGDAEDDSEHLITKTMIEGAVGEPSAIEFLGFVAIFGHLPSVEKILKGTELPEPPSRSEPGQMYAFCAALVSGAYQMAGRMERVKAIRHLLNYMTRKFKSGLAEFAVKTLYDLHEAPQYKEVAAEVEDSSELENFSDAFEKLM